MKGITLFTGLAITAGIGGLLYNFAQNTFDHPAKTVNFSRAYQTASKGKVHYETPEVYELVNITILLSGYNENNHQAIFKNSQYAQEVFAYFKPYMNDPCVNEFTTKVRTINNNYAARDSSYAYEFGVNGKIITTGVYSNIIPYETNLLPLLVPKLESFVKTSNFRQFYANHQPYYERTKKICASLSKAEMIWKWLENRYPQRVDSYRIVCSPLTGGNHRTDEGLASGFHEILMFISAPQSKKTYFEIDQFRAIRTVLTEIDHNYVNPTTKELENTFPNLMSPQNKWAKGFGGKAYNTSKMVFNEYMTWGLFSLFLADAFPKQKTEFAMKECEEVMVNRDFYRFPEFNQELLRFYRANQNSSGEQLQSHMMKWSSERR
jgi:hypothetical protein